jgi:hypothetical protein
MANHGRKIASDITAEFASVDDNVVAVAAYGRSLQEDPEIRRSRARA